MERSTNSVLFFIKGTKPLRDGTAPIFLRITVNGKRSETSTGCSILQQHWEQKAQRVQRSTNVAREINDHLASCESRIRVIRTKQQDQGRSFTARSIMNEFHGKGAKDQTIVGLFNKHNSKMADLVKVDHNSPSTLRRYQDSLNHLIRYMKDKYRTDLVMMGDVDHEFIEGFEHHLKVKAGNQHNTAMRHIKCFRKIVRHALSTQLIDLDPFMRFRMTIKPVRRDCLTQEEVKLIQEKRFDIPRIRIVKDLFILQCFTGLAYVDLSGLTKENIEFGADGSPKSIVVDRKKTGERCFIPLLPGAVEILNSYSDHPVRQLKGKLLPVPSNQKMNAYLKEIGDLCGIKKALTTHLARHTFATMALSNGVQFEVVSKLLGHSDLKTTRIYAKLLDDRVISEMDAFADQLAK